MTIMIITINFSEVVIVKCKIAITEQNNIFGVKKIKNDRPLCCSCRC